LLYSNLVAWYAGAFYFLLRPVTVATTLSAAFFAEPLALVAAAFFPQACVSGQLPDVDPAYSR